MNNLNNSEWEVKDDKVRVGNDWRDKKSLQKSLFFEVLLFIGSVALCTWAFTINTIFGIVTLFVSLFFLILAMATLNILKALGVKFELPKKKQVKVEKDISKEKDTSILAGKVVPIISKENFDIEYSFQATLSKTGTAEAQEIIQTLVVDGLFDIDEEFTVITQLGRKLGSLSPSSIAKLETYKEYKKKCKILTVGENKAGKKTVKVEVLVVK